MTFCKRSVYSLPALFTDFSNKHDTATSFYFAILLVPIDAFFIENLIARYDLKSFEMIIFCITGTRIGQASECFIYWKDPMTNDTWGLNFTSPIDAKQFRECCVSYMAW